MLETGTAFFAVGEFMLLQSATTLPPLPTWATLVGQAYQLTPSPDTPDLSAASLSIRYLSSEVPAGEEDGITVYYVADGSSTWQALPTTLNRYHNLAAAPYAGPGRYALMSSIRIPLRSLGWNNIGYPVQATRPIRDGLAAIAGSYDLAYTYLLTDTRDPWKLYAPNAEPWVSNLFTLEFGQGYWLHITNTHGLTLEVRGSSQVQVVTTLPPAPPATVYGQVALPIGARVEARIGATVCGVGSTRDIGQQRVGFVVDVFADDGDGGRGCGQRDRMVTLYANQQVIGQFGWNNQRLADLNRVTYRVLLPVTGR